MAPTPTYCHRKQALSDSYSVALREYSKAVLALGERQKWPRRDSFALAGAAQEAKFKAEKAKLDYEKHIAEHGC